MRACIIKEISFFTCVQLIPNLAFRVFLIKGIYIFINTGESILRLNTFGNAFRDVMFILGSCLFRGVTGCGKQATQKECK